MNTLTKIAVLSCLGAVAVAGHSLATADSLMVTNPVYTEWVGAPRGLRLYIAGRIISHVQPYCSRVQPLSRPQPLRMRGMPSGGNWPPTVLCPSHKPIGYGVQQSLTEAGLRRARLSCLETPG